MFDALSICLRVVLYRYMHLYDTTSIHVCVRYLINSFILFPYMLTCMYERLSIILPARFHIDTCVWTSIYWVLVFQIGTFSKHVYVKKIIEPCINTRLFYVDTCTILHRNVSEKHYRRFDVCVCDLLSLVRWIQYVRLYSIIHFGVFYKYAYTHLNALVRLFGY